MSRIYLDIEDDDKGEFEVIPTLQGQEKGNITIKWNKENKVILDHRDNDFAF